MKYRECFCQTNILHRRDVMSSDRHNPTRLGLGKAIAPPEFDPFLRAIGTLVVNFNRADQVLRYIACVLIDPNDTHTGWIVLDTVGVSRVEELVKALARHRIKDTALLSRVSDALDEAAKVRTLRNDFVHTMWLAPGGDEAAPQFQAAKPPNKSTTQYRPLRGSDSVRTIEDASSRALAVSDDLWTLLWEVQQLI